jgi:hypothetical protein
MTKRNKRKSRPPANRRKTGSPLDSRRAREIGKATQFQPGTSGNPQGRPRTKIFRQIAREIVEMVDAKKKKQRARILLEALFKEAEKGSLGHFNAIQRMLEEDSSASQARIELKTEVVPAVKRMRSTEDVIAALREIYGLGPKKPEDSGACKELPLESTSIQP